MSKRKCRIKVMKEHSPIKNQLKTYMLWPLVMVGFMILANISVALIDRRAGAAMGGFTFPPAEFSGPTGPLTRWCGKITAARTSPPISRS